MQTATVGKRQAALEKARAALAAKRKATQPAAAPQGVVRLPAWAMPQESQLQQWFDNAKPGDSLTLVRPEV